MTLEQAIRARERLLKSLPVTGEILRGSLLEQPFSAAEQKKRWFRNGQKWRTGCEGRISVVKPRHGLSRCRYKGESGMKRWVGLGAIADNLINIGNAMARQVEP